MVYTPEATTLSNGDICQPGEWIIWLDSSQSFSLNSSLSAEGMRIGQVLEIIQIAGSAAHNTGKCNFLVVNPAIRGETHPIYRMPAVILLSKSELVAVPISVSLMI